MKKSSFILLILILPTLLVAQEKTKQKEVGLLFSNLDQFGITFKTGTNKSLWRFNTLFLSGYNGQETSDSLYSDYSNIGFNFQVGHEFRTNISDNLEFRYGADLSFSFSQAERDINDKSIDNRDSYSKIMTYEPGINLIIGFNYIINDNLVFGAELLPSVSYRMIKKEEEMIYGNYIPPSDNSSFRYGLSNSSARLSLVYRF